MDRKGKRHVVGTKTSRADRKRRRLNPLNQYDLENSNISTSWRKLRRGDLKDTTMIDSNISYRILNFVTVCTGINQFINNCKVCGSEVKFVEKSKRGFKIVIQCQSYVIEAIRPIYEDLSRNDLLERCLGAYNQNNNESFNAVIWKFVPKTSFSGTNTVEIAANIVTILFNEGHTGLRHILEELGVRIGETLYQYCTTIVTNRVDKAERRSRASTHEGRLHALRGYKSDDDDSSASEELLYGPGIAD